MKKECTGNITRANDSNVSLFRAVREGLGFKQKEAAEIIGVNRSFVSKLEHNVEPNFSMINRLISAAGGRFSIVATFPDKPGFSITIDKTQLGSRVVEYPLDKSAGHV